MCQSAGRWLPLSDKESLSMKQMWFTELFGIKIVSFPTSLKFILSNFVPAFCVLFIVFCSERGFVFVNFSVDSSNLSSFAFLCFTYLNISCLHGRDVVRLSCSEFPEPDFITILLASLQFTLDSNQLGI